MGSATSKAARKLPKRIETPSWTGSSTVPKSKKPQPREQKDQAIEDDARDPHFMANLSRLGAVKVDHHMQAFQPAQKSREMIETRIQSEQEARNRVQASTLSNLLDKSKSNMSRQEMEKLANEYGMDIEKLEKLTEHITTPSIKNNSAIRTVRKEDGEEEVSVMAIWVEPRAFK